MINKFRKFRSFIINKVNTKRKSISLGEHCMINGCPIFNGNISFGNNCRINSGAIYNPIGGSNECIFITNNNGMIKIGNNVGISNSALVSSTSIIIEDNVMIGGNTKIYDTDFHSLNFENRMMKPDLNIISLPVQIKEGAFIGAHSIILKGVTIGKKSIVGAGSVVAKSIPDGEVWAGNPAKFIKKVL